MTANALRRRSLLPLLSMAIAIAAVACDKKNEESPAKAAAAPAKTDAPAAKADTPAPAPTTAAPTAPVVDGGTATATPTPTPTPTASVNLGRSVWVSGFKVTLGDVTYDPQKGELAIAIEAENLTRGDTPLYSTFLLVAEDAQIASGSLAGARTVVALGKVRDRIVFGGIGEAFGTPYDPTKTLVVLGAGTETQAKVQIDGKGTADVDNAPIDQEFTAQIDVGQATFSIEKSQIRFDNVPAGAITAEKGKVYFVMTGSWRNTSAKGVLYLDSNRITLTSADGVKNTPDSFSTETSLAETKKDDKLAIVFKLDAAFAGEYKLDITQPFGAEGADATASKAVTLAPRKAP